MQKIRLLDCTLRDGGYVNDWKFGYNNLNSIFMRLVDANVDIIEIGFLDGRRPFDVDRSIMPDTESVKKIYGKLNRKQAMVVGMIDYGTCDISHIQLCENSYLDGIRVIFKKHLMHEAMEYCRQLKKMGYRVFSQLVSITSYTEEDLLELISLVNDVKPYAVSMVDTYGLLKPESLLYYYKIIDENVDTDIQIGFHAHNNFQLAYANSLAFLAKEAKHDIVVDGTLYGMGKSAGNAPIELLAMTLNEKYHGAYNINSMMEAIEESVLDFFAQAPWGYKPFFYLCALNKCHPNYLTYYNEKQNLSVSKVDELLSMIEPEDKKLLYDKLVAEQLYADFIEKKDSDKKDKEKLKSVLKGKKVLLVGPGKNILLQNAQVQNFVAKNHPFVISINYVPSQVHADCVFVTNARRYLQLTKDMQKEENQGIQLLATTNIECKNGKFDYQVDRASLLESNEKIVDNSFLMLVKLLKDIEIKHIYCAGFDGYSENEDNYFDPSMEYLFVKKEALHLNKHMKKAINMYRETIKIEFITFSAYDQEEDINGAAF